MSVINKKPFIQKVLDTLDAEGIASLSTLLNGAETTYFKSFINNSYALTTSDKGIKHVVLETKDQVFTGYLIYNNSYCVLIAYNGDKNQKLQLIDIDVAHDSYELVDEELSITELRMLVSGGSGQGTDEWTDEVKEFIQATDDGIEVSGELEMDEDATFGSVMSGKLYGELKNSFVKVIAPPESTTLTDAEMAIFEKGVFVNGSFLSMKNPVFFPYESFEGNTSYYAGLVIGEATNGNTDIKLYIIHKTTKVISTTTARGIVVDNVIYFNRKPIPAYPADTGTFVLKMVNGVLTWVEEQ